MPFISISAPKGFLIEESALTGQTTDPPYLISDSLVE